VLRLDVPESEHRLSEQLGYAPTAQVAPDQLSRREGIELPDRPSRHGSPASRSSSFVKAKLERLSKLGWSVEVRECYRLARLQHRQILLFNDGRIVFKDPTIRGRHQYDGEWLKVTAFLWPDTTF